MFPASTNGLMESRWIAAQIRATADFQFVNFLHKAFAEIGRCPIKEPKR